VWRASVRAGPWTTSPESGNAFVRSHLRSVRWTPGAAGPRSSTVGKAGLRRPGRPPEVGAGLMLTSPVQRDDVPAGAPIVLEGEVGAEAQGHGLVSSPWPELSAARCAPSMYEVMTTRAFSPRERLGFWNDVICRLLVPKDVLLMRSDEEFYGTV